MIIILFELTKLERWLLSFKYNIYDILIKNLIQLRIMNNKI